MLAEYGGWNGPLLKQLPAHLWVWELVLDAFQHTDDEKGSDMREEGV